MTKRQIFQVICFNKTKKIVSVYNIKILLCTVLAFLWTHNYKILNPLYTEWMHGSGDLSNVLISWNYYRQSPNIQWPITLNNLYGDPWSRTITFSDVPALIAVPLKYLTVGTEKIFQFTGIQTLICIYLSIFFGSKTLKLFGLKTNEAILGSILVTLSPTLLFRSYFYHYSLNMSWIVFASLFIYLKRGQNQFLFAWPTLFFIAITTMPYMALFVLVFYSASVSSSILAKKYPPTLLLLKKTLYSVLPTGTAIMIALIFIGFWFNNQKSSDYGFGYYNANLNSLINPFSSNVSWSQLIPPLGLETEGQYEGFGFLGISILVMIMTLSVMKTKLFLQRLSQTIENHKFLTITLSLSALLSTGLSFTIASHNILTLQLPIEITQKLSIFRSSGRLMILLVIVISIAIIVYFKTLIAKKNFVVTMIFLIILQLWDMNSPIKQIKLNEGKSFENEINRNFDHYLELTKPNEVIFVLPENSAYWWKMKLIWESSKKGIKVNDGFFARPNLDAQLKEKERIIDDLTSKKPARKALYVFYPYEQDERLANLNLEKIFGGDGECKLFAVEDQQFIKVCMIK